MQHMVSATDSINAKLAALSEKASNINSVLITITKVADQTNILSLNAAIEAEKAGDAGRGFSVVATEIRRLADQTSVSTWDIEQMLKEMQSAVSASVMGMDKFSEEIRRSVGEVRQVAEQLSSRDGPGAEAGAAIRRRAARHAVAGGRRLADFRHHDAAERRHPADGGIA